MKNSKRTRGHGKREFAENREFVIKRLNAGDKAFEIYNALKLENKITVDISVFRRYVRQLKASQAVTEQTAISDTSLGVLRSSHLPTHPSNNPRPKKVSLFTPKPADLEDEFADVTPSGSEVSHG